MCIRNWWPSRLWPETVRIAMNPNTLRFIVVAVALVLMMAMVLTGLLLKYVLPPGSGGREGGRGLVLWGMGRHDWGDIHWYIALTLLAVTVVHLLLHWSWVVTLPNRWLRGPRSGSSLPGKGARRIAAVIFFLAIAGLVGGWLALAKSQVVQREGLHEHRGSQRTGPGERRHHGRSQRTETTLQSAEPQSLIVPQEDPREPDGAGNKRRRGQAGPPRGGLRGD